MKMTKFLQVRRYGCQNIWNTEKPSSLDKKIIVLDTETTGLSHENDEILQLSIIDGEYNTLFGEYFKPKHTTNWDEAEKVNRISPEMVKNKLEIDNYKWKKLTAAAEYYGYKFHAHNSLEDTKLHSFVMIRFIKQINIKNKAVTVSIKPWLPYNLIN